MQSKHLWWATALFMILSAAAMALAQSDTAGYTTAAMPDKVKSAIEKSLADEAIADSTKQIIKPGEPEGFMGIPSAPKPNLIVGLLWAIWVN